MRLTVSFAAPFRPFRHFWRATGFTPATRLFEREMQINLAWLGSLPGQGIEHVRIHSLLDLVSLPSLEPGASPDFARLDAAIDILRLNRLKPFFELMGNPSRLFTDFTDPRQLAAWRGLVASLARHLIDRFGRDEVRTWYFETWNEPDCPTWWPQFETHPEALCLYFDACRAGLDDVDTTLRLGGPGGCQNLNPTTRTFFAHVAARRIDFISYHEKGGAYTAEDMTPDSVDVLHRERKIMALLKELGLSHVPVMNNEADPEIGWNQHHSWHARAYYAAWIVRAVIQRLAAFIDRGIAYEMLLQDNGFVGTWGMRSLIARLGQPKEIEAGRFDMLPKPVFHAMTMLSLLGGQRLDLPLDEEAEVAVLPTRHPDGTIALLLVRGVDELDRGVAREIELDLRDLPHEIYTLTHYKIADHGAGDAFALADNRADFHLFMQSEHVRALHRASAFADAGPSRPVTTKHGRLRLKVHADLPSVHLFILSRPAAAPDAVAAPRVETYESLQGPRRLVCWEAPPSPLIRRYQVQRNDADDTLIFSDSPCGVWVDFDPPEESSHAARRYRVRAITVDGVPGAWSPWSE